MHGGVETNLEEENVDALIKGCANLNKHISSMHAYNLPYVVAINKFSSDTQAEIDALLNWCKENHHPVSLCEGWSKGGKGVTDLAEKVVSLVEQESDFKCLYDENDTIENKIYTIAHTIYGASNVEYSDKAKNKIDLYVKNGWDKLPICMAKTPNSLTDDDKIKGCPTDFTIHVRDINISKGAGFIVVYTGNVLTMPGLPKVPAALGMGIDDEGNSYGIF